MRLSQAEAGMFGSTAGLMTVEEVKGRHLLVIHTIHQGADQRHAVVVTYAIHHQSQKKETNIDPCYVIYVLQ